MHVFRPGHVAAGWESLGVLTGCPDAATGGRGTHPLNPTLNKTFDVYDGLDDDLAHVSLPASTNNVATTVPCRVVCITLPDASR